VFNLCAKVMKMITFRAEAILKPGSHSSSTYPGDFEDFSFVNQLAVKLYKDCQIWVDQVEAERLQAASEEEKKQNASDFVVPPPPALGTCNILSSLSFSAISNSTSVISGILNNNVPKTTSLCNNTEECDLLDEDEDGKENSFSVMEKNNKKKRRKTVMAGNDAGTLFYAAMVKPDLSMDLMAKMFAEYQRSEAAAEERRMQKEAEAEERHLKAEEHTQHRKLLEMLHDGKISRDIYEAMKP
jgi:hypothetical protein